MLAMLAQHLQRFPVLHVSRPGRPRERARKNEPLLRLLFSDGTVGDVDFSSERWTGVLEPLNNPAYFARVEVDSEAGTVVWPRGIDLAPEPLYEQAKAHPLAAA